MIAFLAAILLAGFQSQPDEGARCATGRAQRATVYQITRYPDRYMGRCVTVSGPASGTTIYSGREGIYLAHRGHGGLAEGRPASNHRIGLYGNDIRRRFSGGPPIHLIVTGIVDSCERWAARLEAQRSPDSLPIMMGGYCHWHDGPVIRAASFRTDPSVRYERLSGEAARRDYGSIRRMPPDWPHRTALERFAGEFLRALRAGDRAAMAALHDVSPAQVRRNEPLLRYLFEDPDSPFAQIRTGSEPQGAIFVYTAPQSFAFSSPGPEPEGFACFCRAGDCSDRWPISWSDTANAPLRPYVCTRIEPQDWTERRAGLSTPAGRAWLPESDRTAFRR